MEEKDEDHDGQEFAQIGKCQDVFESESEVEAFQSREMKQEGCEGEEQKSTEECDENDFRIL